MTFVLPATELYSASSHAAFCGSAHPSSFILEPRSTNERLQLPRQCFWVSCPLYYMPRLAIVPSLHDFVVLRSFSHMMHVCRPIHHHGVGKGYYTPYEQIIYQRPLHSSLLLRLSSHCLGRLIALTSYQTPFILFDINHASEARSTDKHSFGANMGQKYICSTSALQTRARCKRDFDIIK